MASSADAKTIPGRRGGQPAQSRVSVSEGRPARPHLELCLRELPRAGGNERSEALP